MADPYDEFDFTPTEALVLEVLTARYRLGNNSWTFEARSNGAIQKLAARGLVNSKSASVEKATLVWLTEDGIAIMLANKYRSPIKFSKLKKLQKELRARAKAALKESNY